MKEPRIDTLRKMVAAVGAKQLEYYSFFPAFADRLELELAQFLGDPDCAALSSATGEFTFDHGSYRHEGIGFERGRFRIPLMFRLKNMKDEGELLVRILVFFTMDGDHLLAEIDGQPPVRFPKDDTIELLEVIFQHLRGLFDQQNWFSDRGADYAGTGIGFVQDKSRKTQ